MKNLLIGFSFLSLIAFSAFSAFSSDSHTTTGVIMGVGVDGQVLTIHHDDFPDFMESMTMPFNLFEPSLANGLKEGDHVVFTIQRTETGYPIVEIKKVGDS